MERELMTTASRSPGCHSGLSRTALSEAGGEQVATPTRIQRPHTVGCVRLGRWQEVICAAVMVLIVGSAQAATVRLGAAGGDARIDLNWTSNEPITSVQVYRDTDANPSGRQRIAILRGNARSYTDTAVGNGQQYWYWIKYTDAARNVGNSNAGSATPTATGPMPENGGATCSGAVSAKLPLAIQGAGDHCLVTTGSIRTINSWKTERVEINGESFTNRWSNRMPMKVDGKYYVRYVGKYPWSHLEVSGSGGADGGTQPIAVTGITVMPTRVSLNTGATASLSAIVQPANASDKSVSWRSSNTAIATVNAAGVATGIAAGSATITVTTADGGRTASSKVTVTQSDQATPVTGVAVMPTAGNVVVGGSISLSATVQPGNASNKAVSWSSSNTGVATVNAAGVVTGIAAGIANITVRTADKSRTASSMVTVAKQDTPPIDGQGDPYTWPGYAPDLNYDFRQDFANIDPGKFTVYKGCSDNQIAGVKTSGWFAFIWGHNRNPSITDADVDRVLKNLNEDMAFARDKMGWPPDRLSQEGHFSNVYLFGSGLCTDNASSTEKGGWQSGINGYPMVLLSYYPVVTPGERGGITHEAIHATLATMGNKAAWFNEGGNTWLQMNMEAARTSGYGVGFLDGAPFLAPHMPIENYSGWLQDGSFGGPNAEGVNQYRNGQQISTWREYLGGNQYNSAFAHFLAVHVSPGANAWIWKNGKSNGVLASLAEGLGEDQVRHLIMEYRARQAMVDFGPWSNAFKGPINDNWGRRVGAERINGGILQEVAPYRLGFYADTTRQGDTLVPSADTLPGWSGANQIPLQTNGTTVRVDFQPIGQNMRLQLAYRAQDGSAVYSQPVEKGEVSLNLSKTPKNGVVVAIVSNTDYQYQGDETRKRKYDYRIRLLEGISGSASTTEKHYQ